ncbi:PREDICTED: facilitated trehalose transporter Tret1-2 homolog, partial [Eufriesea mexicana]|uniref:facilitated trehalose transporter Tret1-2 homolog n=1 Tax=Eufriesea mexicana TaxID=516756 RepID=UPI00083C02A3
MPRASVVHMTSTATRPQHMSQVLATLALSMGTLSSGLAKGYTSPALDSILDNQPSHLYQSSNNDTWSAFSVTQQEASWVASLSMLGAWFGAMIGVWIMRRGRRLALRVTSFPLAVVWILTGIAPCVELVYVTSFIGGLCCSVITMVAQVYISEISMPGIRGCLSAMLKVLGHVGVLLSYIAGTYLNWRQSALLVAIAPPMLFLGTLFIPETPSYLVLNGKDDEAANSLQWLRGDHVDIRHELQVIKTNILASRAEQYELTFKNSMFTPRLYKPIAITCGLMFFQRFSGANAFNYYAVIIFRQTLGGMNPHGATIAIGFVQLLASLLSGFLIDIVGRLPLLIASTVFMSLALAGFGSYAYYMPQTQNLGYPDSAVVGHHDWIPLLCVLVFTTALALGISPISWLLIGELFPLEYRGLGSSISTSFNYFCAFIGIKLFMDFQQTFGLHGTFWFYAAVAVCGLCFVLCCVPETKGKQLDEMNPGYAGGAYPNQHDPRELYNANLSMDIPMTSGQIVSYRSNRRKVSDYCNIFAQKANRIGRILESFMLSHGLFMARRSSDENSRSNATTHRSNGDVIRNDYRFPDRVEQRTDVREQDHRRYTRFGRDDQDRYIYSRQAYAEEGSDTSYVDRNTEMQPRRVGQRDYATAYEDRGSWRNSSRDLNGSKPIPRKGISHARGERLYSSTLPRRSRTINFRDQLTISIESSRGYPRSLQDLSDL